jgi:putative ABC transport system permease protein
MTIDYDLPSDRDSAATRIIRMAPKLAFQNLVHDRVSLSVTLTGIVFSVVLIAVQCGLYIGSERTIAAVLDQTKADLWIVPIGTKSFDDPNMLNGRERFAALSVDGVAEAEDLVVSFASWRKPKGGNTTVLVVGSDRNGEGLKPWNIVEGSLDELAAPNAIAVDKVYLEELGIDGLGATAEVNGQKVSVTALTNGIRSFTTMPYVFTSLQRAQKLFDMGPEQSQYTILRLKPGADIATARSELSYRLPDVEVLSHKEFHDRSIDYWMFSTAAGTGLIAGSILGLVVGIVIVAQTLYASTKDHLNEFATLRALGASGSYIHQVILIQALISALLGYVIGISLCLLLVWLATDTSFTLVITPGLGLALFIVTILMCTMAAMAAIFKVTRIDPSGVFSR